MISKLKKHCALMSCYTLVLNITNRCKFYWKYSMIPHKTIQKGTLSIYLIIHQLCTGLHYKPGPILGIENITVAN